MLRSQTSWSNVSLMFYVPAGGNEGSSVPGNGRAGQTGGEALFPWCAAGGRPARAHLLYLFLSEKSARHQRELEKVSQHWRWLVCMLVMVRRRFGVGARATSDTIETNPAPVCVGQLMVGLILDFLQVFHLDFTLSVFRPEINSVCVYTFRIWSVFMRLALVIHHTLCCILWFIGKRSGWEGRSLQRTVPVSIWQQQEFSAAARANQEDTTRRQPGNYRVI